MISREIGGCLWRDVIIREARGGRLSSRVTTCPIPDKNHSSTVSHRPSHTPISPDVLSPGRFFFSFTLIYTNSITMSFPRFLRACLPDPPLIHFPKRISFGKSGKLLHLLFTFFGIFCFTTLDAIRTRYPRTTSDGPPLPPVELSLVSLNSPLLGRGHYIEHNRWNKYSEIVEIPGNISGIPWPAS